MEHTIIFVVRQKTFAMDENNKSVAGKADEKAIEAQTTADNAAGTDSESATPKKKKRKSVPKVLVGCLLWLIGIVLLIVVGLVLVAEFAHDKVVKMALPSVQNILNAPVDIGQTSLSFIRSFPYATLELNGVYLGSVFKTNTKADSLVYVEKVYVSLKTEPLKNGKIEITEVEFKGATIKYLVDKEGATSYDFLMSTDTTPKITDTSSMGLVIDLEKLTISDITLIYDDRKLGAHAKAYIPKITAKGALSDSLIQAQIKGSVQVTEVDYDSTNANQLQMAELKIDVDYVGEDITVNDVSLSLDDIIIAISGSAKITDSIYTNVHATCDNVDLADVIKYAPDGLLDEFGVKKVEGKLHFSADVSGNISDTTRYPHVDANLGFDKGLVLMDGYPQVKNIGIDVDLTTGKHDNDATIGLNLKGLHFDTDKSSGTIKLTASNINRPRYNLNANFHVDMSEVAPFIPDSLGISKLTGSVDVGANTTGVYTGNVDNAFIEKALHNTSIVVGLNKLCVAMDSVIAVDTLNMNMVFKNYGITINNTNLKLPDYGISLDDFGLDAKIDGSIFNLSKTTVDVNNLHIGIADSKVDMTAKVSNLEMPTYEANVGIDLKLNNFINMLPDSLAYSLDGGVAVNVNSHGTVNLDSISTQMYDLIINNTDVGVSLNRIGAEMYDSIASFSGLVGKIKIANDTVCVDSVSVDWKGLTLHVDSTVVENVMKIFLLEQNANKLMVLTKVSLDDFDYDWIEKNFPSNDSTAQAEAEPEIEPEPIADVATDSLPQPDSVVAVDTAPYSFLALGYPVEVKGMFKLGHLQYGKSSIDTVSAKFLLNDTVAVVENLRLGAFKGSMNASARVKFKNDSLMDIWFRTHIDKMDLKQLLVEFDNFDQTDVTSENLSGLMTTDLDGYLEMVNGDSVYFDMVPIKVLGRLKLEEGAIVNLEMLKKLDKVTGMNELDNIQFQTLETSLFVRHGSLFLPQTDIKTTAMNMSVFAMQGMANKNFEYHLKIFPGEILFGKWKGVMKKQQQMKENLADEDNMKSFNLLAYEIDGDSKYGFDTESRKKKMRTRIKVQQHQLELGFNPRLVKYNTDVKFR